MKRYESQFKERITINIDNQDDALNAIYEGIFLIAQKGMSPQSIANVIASHIISGALEGSVTAEGSSEYGEEIVEALSKRLMPNLRSTAPIYKD